MTKEKHLFEIRSLQLFIFPPWSIYKLISDKKVVGHKMSRIFLLFWVIIQWSLLIAAGTNKVLALFSSNLSIAMFFLINFYFGLDMHEFSEDDRKSLSSLPLRLLVTIAAFVMMYSIQRVVSETAANMHISHVVHFTQLHKMIGVILLVAWFIFSLIDRYELLAMFPKTEYKDGVYRLIPLTPEKIALFYIMYVFLIICLVTYG